MLVDGVQVTCPKCGLGFPLTDALAQPLIAAAMAETLRAERDRVLKDAQRKAAEEYATKLKAAEQELAEKTHKLAQAEKAELQTLKDRRALEDAKRNLELEVQRRVHEQSTMIRETIKREEEELHQLQLAEREKLISDMRQQIEELRRKGEQGSVQLKGEVLEVRLESLLRAAFPTDQIKAVPNGRSGGDVVQEIAAPNGVRGGIILWETKNVKNWSAEWLPKVRQDQRNVNAHVAIIVTTALPKEIRSFDRVGGVWVTSTECALPLAKAVRAALMSMSMAVVAARGREEKAVEVYGYITGQQFKVLVSAIVEGCAAIHEGVESQMRFMTRQWAKQHKHLELLLTSTAKMHGDLQAIAGKALPEVEGLSGKGGE